MSAPSHPEKRRGYLVGAAVLAVLVLAPSLLYPFGRDQAVFAYVGSVMAQGGAAYRDAWDLKPPGIYALYALLAAVAPDDGYPLMVLVRVTDVLFAAMTGMLLAMLARRWDRPEIGWAAAAWYAALYLQGGFWSLAQTEAWANPLALGACLACLGTQAFGRSDIQEDAPVPKGRLIAAGLLTGFAAALKFTAVAPVVPFVLHAASRNREDRVRPIVFIGGAALLVLAASSMWMRLVDDMLRAYADIQSGFVAPYARLNAEGVGARVGNAANGVWRWLQPMWGPALLWLALASFERSRRRAALPLAALLCAVAAVVVQNKFFLYHWNTALPWAALLAAWGSVVLFQRLGWSPRAVTAAAVALPLAWSLAGRWSAYRDAALYTTGQLSREGWYRRFNSGKNSNDYSFIVDEEVARYVKAETAPDDPILVWGFEPAVYLLSGRRAPTRFFFNVPVAVPFSPERWKHEFLAQLELHPPRLVLVLSNDAIPWANGLKEDSAEQLQNWPELSAWLGSGYRFEKRIEDFAIYRRR